MEEPKNRKFGFLKFGSLESLETIEDILNNMKDNIEVVGITSNENGFIILVRAKK